MSDLAGTKGGSGVWQRIISEMPAHQVYIEPFWGRGTIARFKRPAAVTIGCDLDPDAIASGRVLGALMFQTCGLQWLLDYFQLVPPPAATRPAASQPGAAPAGAGRNGVGRSASARTAPRNGAAPAETTRGLPPPAASPDLPAPAAAATFGGISWAEHFVYLDPPYLIARNYYRHCFTGEQHRQLCRVFRALPCPAALSGYPSRSYADELDGIRSVSIPTVNRRGKRVLEILWLNYPPPARYHDVRFIGANRRGRERIRRRVRNWRAGLAKMSAQEQQAVFEACAAAYGGNSC